MALGEGRVRADDAEQMTDRQCWLIFSYRFEDLHTTAVSVNENHITRIPCSLGNKICLQELIMDCSSKNILALKGYIGTCPNQWLDFVSAS